MQLFRRIRRTVLFFSLLLIAVLFASCAKANAQSDLPLSSLVPDAGQQTGRPVEGTVYSDDVVIGVVRPDFMEGVDKNPGTSGGSGTLPEDGSSDGTVEPPAEPDGTEDPDTQEPPTGEQDPQQPSDTDDGMEDYEGSDSDAEREDDFDETDGETYFDPEEIEIGENAGKLDFYDVPLSESKQAYAIHVAEEFEIPPELIFGVMYVESKYNENAISSNGKYIGMMQIAKSNLSTLTKKFGITDLQDYLQNVRAGAYFLSYFYKKYDGNIDKVLMCYHRGEGGASVQWRKGVTQDSYCRKVRAEINRIRAAA